MFTPENTFWASPSKNLPPIEADSVSGLLFWTPLKKSKSSSFQLSGTGVILQERTITIGTQYLDLSENIPIEQPVSWLQWWQSDCVTCGTHCLYLGMTGVKITNWRNFIGVYYLGSYLGKINNVFGVTPSEYLKLAGIESEKIYRNYIWS